MTVYVRLSPDGEEVLMRPVSTEPHVSVDAVWELPKGQSAFGLPFDEWAKAVTVEVREGKAIVVERRAEKSK